MNKKDIISDIKSKYQKLDEDPDVYLEGLLETLPTNYWDYVEVETLLTLQKPKTQYKDEEVFIMYHQVTEIIFKMMIHEIKQLVYNPLDEKVWIDKFSRLNRYISMLINSFDVMRLGINYEDYNAFRKALTPASGFQSAQFRLIEIYCTRLTNLIDDDGKKLLEETKNIKEAFEHVYWKKAGVKASGEKTLTLQQFEDKYLGRLIFLTEKVKGRTLEEKFQDSKVQSPELVELMKKFDYDYNISWPLVHMRTAEHYLNQNNNKIEATGGSDWKKYLHPKSQRRIFFPLMWSEGELENWGNT